MDQQTLITLVVGIIVAILGLVWRYYKATDPLKSWIEMLFSILGGFVVALALGKVPAFINWNNPVATLQYLLEISAVIFAFVELIYNAVKAAFPSSVLVVRAFKK
jgi:phage-related minor tail protein